MNAFIDAALSRSRTVIAAFLLILIVGMVSYVTVPKESEPDVQIPWIIVNMHLDGISPEDGERLLLRPMESELRGISGVKELRGNAFESGAYMTLEFEAGFDGDQAMIDVRDKVDVAKAELPDSAEEPIVNEINLSLFPVVVVTLSGQVSERALTAAARRVRDEIEALPGVLEVDIGGDREEQVEVVIDPTLVESYGLSSDALASFLGRSNQLIAAGAVDTGTGRFAVKVPGLINTIEDILALPLVVDGDSTITVGDIATVRRTFKDDAGYARVNGSRAVALEVKKRLGENAISTVAQVKAVVEAVRPLLPEGMQLDVTQNRADDILTMLNDLQNNVIAAVLLVMVVVVAALGLRSGFLVGIAIPGSFLAAIMMIHAAGLTINIVVLFSLILAVGMLVDGAIVVTEYADRKLTEGLPRREAYALAAKRMAWPVIASTATTLAAFLPLLFWTGIMGEFMKFMPMTLMATLSASLVMALIVVPTLGSLFGRAGAADPETMKALSASTEVGDLTALGGLTGWYARLLTSALCRPGWVLIGALTMLVVAQTLYWSFGKGVQLFPDIEPEAAQVLVHAQGNLSVDAKDKLVWEVEQRVLGLPDFRTVYARSGFRPNESAEDVVGVVSLEFKDWENRRPASVVFEDIRQRTADLAGVYVEVRKQEGGPQQGKPVRVQLAAADVTLLEPAGAHIRRGMEELGGFVDVEDDGFIPGIQWTLNVDRAQAAKFGVDVLAVGDMVQMVTRGLKFSEYRPDDTDDEVDIVARFAGDYRSLDALSRLRVATAQGNVPISSFVTMEPEPVVSTIHRTDGRRTLTVSADVAEDLLPAAQVDRLNAWLADNPLPPDVRLTYKGEDEEARKSEAFLGKAFTIALFLMAIILVTQFNSFYAAFLILSAVIMSTVGVMLGHLLAGQPFGIIMSGVGVIALAGIVVNNNIVLIDTYQRLIKQFPPHEAILRTGVQRLRPVFLTSVTTILGLLPMMFQVGIDFVHRHVSVGAPSSQYWSQMSMSIVAGLTFATVLTLVVTPSALLLRHRLAESFAAWRARRSPEPTLAA